MLHQFFTFVQLCDTQLTFFSLAFSYTLSTPAFARSTYKCFATSTCMTVAEGPPPSHKEHCLYFIESSGIQDTLWAKLLMSILGPPVLLFVVCRPTFLVAQAFLLKSKDLPSPCIAGGLFFLLHKKMRPVIFPITGRTRHLLRP